MKKLFAVLAALIAVIAVLEIKAADFSGLQSTVNTVFNTASNSLYGPTCTNWPGNLNSRTNYPTYWPAETVVTNVYQIDVRGIKDITLAFTATLTAAAPTNVVLTFCRSLEPFSPTNSRGTGATLEYSYFTWRASFSGASANVAYTVCTNLSDFTYPQLGATPYLWLESVKFGADDDAVMTNASLKYVTQ